MVVQKIEAAIRRCSLKKVFGKYAANLQENIHAEVILIKLHSNFIEIALWHGCSRVNLLHIFRTLFPKNTCGWLLLKEGSLRCSQDHQRSMKNLPKIISCPKRFKVDSTFLDCLLWKQKTTE